uniref:peptide-methionine (R)-S-oxide reductase n=1 Tax=Strigamia maritima TaxID=126957 RepID=T1IXM6_STRMM
MAFCSWRGGEQYRDHFDRGIYVCSSCNFELFSSKSKYEHESPWPAFTETIHEKSVSKREEKPYVFKVSCGKCGQGLGHEFVKNELHTEKKSEDKFNEQ